MGGHYSHRNISIKISQICYEIESSSDESDTDLPDSEEDGCNVSYSEEEDQAVTSYRERCEEEVTKINADLLATYLHLLSENNTSKRVTILESAPLTFYKSLQLMFKCLTTENINISYAHREELMKHKSDKPFIRKYQRGSPRYIKANVLTKGDNIVRILKIILPILIPL